MLAEMNECVCKLTASIAPDLSPEDLTSLPQLSRSQRKKKKFKSLLTARPLRYTLTDSQSWPINPPCSSSLGVGVGVELSLIA